MFEAIVEISPELTSKLQMIDSIANNEFEVGYFEDTAPSGLLTDFGTLIPAILNYRADASRSEILPPNWRNNAGYRGWAFMNIAKEKVEQQVKAKIFEFSSAGPDAAWNMLGLWIHELIIASLLGMSPGLQRSTIAKKRLGGSRLAPEQVGVETGLMMDSIEWGLNPR